MLRPANVATEIALTEQEKQCLVIWWYLSMWRPWQ